MQQEGADVDKVEIVNIGDADFLQLLSAMLTLPGSIMGGLELKQN